MQWLPNPCWLIISSGIIVYYHSIYTYIYIYLSYILIFIAGGRYASLCLVEFIAGTVIIHCESLLRKQRAVESTSIFGDSWLFGHATIPSAGERIAMEQPTFGSWCFHVWGPQLHNMAQTIGYRAKDIQRSGGVQGEVKHGNGNWRNYRGLSHLNVQ